MDNQPPASGGQHHFVAVLILLLVSAAVVVSGVYVGITKNQETGWRDRLPFMEEEGSNFDTKAADLFAEAAPPAGRFTVKELFPDITNFSVTIDPVRSDRIFIRTFTRVVMMDKASGEMKEFDYSSITNGASISAVAVVGDLVLIGHQGAGVSVTNIETDEYEFFDASDGLVDESNIRIDPDPTDQAVVWLSTFRGLSRFNLVTKEFTNYTREIGIPGSSWQPDVFHVDENEVWVRVGANAYNSGGVARFDKASEEWTSWSVETFDVGESYPRVDPVYGALAADTEVLVEEDRELFVFNRETEQWRVVETRKRSDPIRLMFTLQDGWLEYKEKDRLVSVHRESGTKTEIDYASFYRQVVGQNFDLDQTLSLQYDTLSDTYIIYPGRKISADSAVVAFTVSAGNIDEVRELVLSSYFEAYPYNSISVLDHREAQFLFVAGSEVVWYDLALGKVLKVWPLGEITGEGQISGHLYGDYIVFYREKQCELCATGTLYSSVTSVYEKELGTYIKVAEVPFESDAGWWYVRWGESPSEIVLVRSPYAEVSETYALDIEAARYVLSRDSRAEERGSPYADYGEYVWFEGGPEALSISYVAKAGQAGFRALKIRTGVKGEAGYKETAVPLPISKSAFGVQNNYSVKSVEYDGELLWFATDRALVAFNPVTQGWRVYTTEDGLQSNELSRLYVANGVFVVKHQGGWYTYTFTPEE